MADSSLKPLCFLLTAATSAFSQLFELATAAKKLFNFVDIVETRRLVLVALQLDKKNLIVLKDATVLKGSY